MIRFATRRLRNSLITASVLALSTGFYLVYLASHARPAFLTGWTLLVLVLLLALYNRRKRISMLPIGNAAHWLQWHIYMGVIAIFVFLTHAGWWWSGGLLEGLLFFAFALTAASGVLGLCLSRWLPTRLTRYGEELIFERIPGFMAELREDAEKTVLDLARDTGSTTLADFYNRELLDFFSGPRHWWQHMLGAGDPAFMLVQRLQGQRRYLGEDEHASHAHLLELVERKNQLDFHYALQSALKWWLFLHVPATVAMLLLSAVHLVLVYAFTP